MTEVTDTDEMYQMVNEFNSDVNELKSDYLVGQDEEIDDVIENVLLICNKVFLWVYTGDKTKNSNKKMSSENLFKPGSLSSIRFPSQKAIAERIKLKPWERKKTRNKIKHFNSKQVIN